VNNNIHASEKSYSRFKTNNAPQLFAPLAPRDDIALYRL